MARRAAFKQACRIGGGWTGVGPAGDALVVVPVPVAVPEPVVAVVVDGPVTDVQLVVDPEVADPVVVVSFVAVVLGPGATTTGWCPSGGAGEQETIRGVTQPALLGSRTTGGRQPGIAPRTARPRTRRTCPFVGTAAMTNVRS